MSGTGAAPKRQGDAFARKCRAELERAGYWVTRTPAAYDAGVDLIAIRPGLNTRNLCRVLAVQCKRGGYLDPAGREALYVLGQWGIAPIVAVPSIAGLAGLGGISWLRIMDPDQSLAFAQPYKLEG